MMKKHSFVVLLCALTMQLAACADDSNPQNSNPPVVENNANNNDPTDANNNDVGEGDNNTDTDSEVEKPALPSLVIVSPKNAEVLEGDSVEFEIRIEDGPAGGVSWKINDGTPEQQFIDLKPGDVFKQNVEAVPGLNTLQITLHTNDGRRVSEVVVFQLNAAAKPVITLIDELPALVQVAQVDFAASVLAVSGVAEHKLTINGIEVEDITLNQLDDTEDDESVYELVTELPLSIGTNEIVLDVVANNGATASLTLSVSREEDTESPTLSGLFPYSGQSVQTSRVTVFGTVTDNVAVQSVALKLGETPTTLNYSPMASSRWIFRFRPGQMKFPLPRLIRPKIRKKLRILSISETAQPPVGRMAA